MSDLGLNIQKVNDSADFELLYEDTDKPMGITLCLASPDSEVYKAVERKISNERLEKVRRNKNISVEHTEQWRIKLLVGVTTGWKFYPPAVKKGDKGPEFNQVNLRALFEQYPEIAEQVDRFLADRGNFRRGTDQ